MKKPIVAGLIVLLLSLTGEAAAQAVSSANVLTSSGASAGNVTNVNGLTLQGGDIPKQHPQPLTAPVSPPQVFQFLPNQAGLPAELMGADLDEVYQTLCDPTVDGADLPIVPKAGKSGKTKFTFSGHQNLAWVRKGEQRPRVKLNLTGVDTIMPLGMLIIRVSPETLKEGFPMGQSAVSTDAMNSMADELRGVGAEVVLLTHRRFWGGGAGQYSQGSGQTAGFGVNFGLNLGASASDVNGVNMVVSSISIPYIVGVRMPPGDPYAGYAKLLDLRAPQAPQAQPTPLTGGNGKKLEGAQ